MRVRKMTAADLALHLQPPPARQTVIRWGNGTRHPSPTYQKQLSDIFGGEVPVDMWNDHESSTEQQEESEDIKVKQETLAEVQVSYDDQLESLLSQQEKEIEVSLADKASDVSSLEKKHAEELADLRRSVASDMASLKAETAAELHRSRVAHEMALRHLQEVQSVRDSLESRISAAMVLLEERRSVIARVRDDVGRLSTSMHAEVDRLTKTLNAAIASGVDEASVVGTMQVPEGRRSGGSGGSNRNDGDGDDDTPVEADADGARGAGHDGGVGPTVGDAAGGGSKKNGAARKGDGAVRDGGHAGGGAGGRVGEADVRVRGAGVSERAAAGSMVVRGQSGGRWGATGRAQVGQQAVAVGGGGTDAGGEVARGASAARSNGRSKAGKSPPGTMPPHANCTPDSPLDRIALRHRGIFQIFELIDGDGNVLREFRDSEDAKQVLDDGDVRGAVAVRCGKCKGQIAYQTQDSPEATEHLANLAARDHHPVEED